MNNKRLLTVYCLPYFLVIGTCRKQTILLQGTSSLSTPVFCLPENTGQAGIFPSR